jgi:hypothetical protein
MLCISTSAVCSGQTHRVLLTLQIDAECDSGVSRYIQSLATICAEAILTCIQKVPPMISERRLQTIHLEREISVQLSRFRQGANAMRAQFRIGSVMRRLCAGLEFVSDCWRYGLKGVVGTASKHSSLARAADNFGSEERERHTSQVYTSSTTKTRTTSPSWHTTSNATQSIFVAVFINTLLGRRCFRMFSLWCVWLRRLDDALKIRVVFPRCNVGC